MFGKLLRRGRQAWILFTLASLVGAGSLIASMSSASGTSSFTLTRVAGSDRYQTSAALVRQQFSSASTVILASGASYPDALAASYLAGNLKVPVVLTTPDLPMSSATTGVLSALGAHNIVLLGGIAAISQAEQNQLSQTYTVARLAGATRYDTMQAIDEAPGTAPGSVNGVKTALLATGQDFPDALGAGPISYANKLPIVLSTSNTLSPQAQSVLTALNIKQVLILGGTAVMSTATEQQVNGLGIATLARFSGVDRSDTARQLADYAVQNLGFKTTAMDVASGDEAYGGADALSLGPVGGQQDPVPTLITDSVNNPGSALTYANEHSATLVNGIGAGGAGPLPNAVLSALDSAGGSPTTTTTTTSGSGSQSPATACGTSTSSTGSGTAPGSGTTQRPDLSSVSLVSIVPPANSTAANPAGTTIAFNFDHPVNGAAPAKADFSLVPFNAAGAAVTGSTAVISAGSNSTVNVLFSSITSQTALNNYTVANVAPGAGTEPGGLVNPEGHAPIGSIVPVTAGNTAGPDLKSAANFRPALAAGTFAVDLTLDCGAVPTGGGGFHLVLVDDSTVNCTAPAAASTNPSGGNAPGGSGSDELTVVCPEPGAGPFAGSYSAANVARIYMDSGTVTDTASSTTNPVESVLLSGGGSATGGSYPGSPDLTSVSFAPNVAAPGPATVDQVTYTFNKNLFSAPINLGDFTVYRQDGTELNSATGAALVSGSSTSVLATFPQGTLVNAVGASVITGAVTGTNNNVNLPASYAAAGVTPSGVTAAPNLTGESMPSAGSVVFNFDRPVTVTNPADFHLYENNAAGTELACTGGTSVGVAPNNNQVTCTFPAPAAPAVVTLGTVSPGAVTGQISGSPASSSNTSAFSGAA